MSWLGRPDIANLSILPMLIQRFNKVSFIILEDFFLKWQADSKIYMEDLEYPKQYWKKKKMKQKVRRTHATWSQDLL